MTPLEPRPIRRRRRVAAESDSIELHVDILVAEDDRDIADLIAHYVERSGWTPHIVGSGDEALASARKRPFDLLILDVMLPGMSGLEVCRALRADPATSAIPIIMVTARAEETDRIIGLDIGADDYLAKPFSPNELVARIRALMRRSKRAEPESATIRFGSLVMDLERHTVVDGGQEVKLTAKEFLLLQYLLQHRGRVLSRDVLLGDVWGYRYTGAPERLTSTSGGSGRSCRCWSMGWSP